MESEFLIASCWGGELPSIGARTPPIHVPEPGTHAWPPALPWVWRDSAGTCLALPGLLGEGVGVFEQPWGWVGSPWLFLEDLRCSCLGRQGSIYRNGGEQMGSGATEQHPANSMLLAQESISCWRHSQLSVCESRSLVFTPVSQGVFLVVSDAGP